MDDILLTFNPAQFVGAISKISEGITSMDNKMSKSTEKTSEKITKASVSMFTFVKGIAAAKMAIGGFHSIMGKLPEVGRTFSIAGDIISRNLLWPLRQELLPYLQKLLDWVRDNRAMFVRWGQVIANIFRVIISLVKGFIEIAKQIWEKVASGIERIFGKTVSNITELVNIVLFKITAIAQFILLMLEPVFDWIGEMFLNALEYVKSFFNGFSNALGDISPELSDMFESIKDIADAMSGLGDSTGAVAKAFKFLGGVVGAVVGPVLRSIGTVIDALSAGVQELQLKLDMFKAWQNNDFTKMKDIQGKIDEVNKKYSDRITQRWERQVKAWKGFVDTTVEDISPEYKKEMDIAIAAAIKDKSSLTKGEISNSKGKIDKSSRTVLSTNTVNNYSNNITVPIEVKNGGNNLNPDEISRSIKESLKESKYRTGGR